MEFVVKFTSKDIRFPVHLPGKCTGLSALQQVRREIGEHINAKDVLGWIPACYASPSSAIDISMAEHSNHFENCTSLTIAVPAKSLNHFTSLTVFQNVDNSYELRYTVDVDSILFAWEQAGFPLEWDPTKIKY